MGGTSAPARPLLLQGFEGECLKAFVHSRWLPINVINNHPDGPTDRSGDWGAGSKCRTKMKHRPNCADAYAHQKQILISAVSQCVAAPRHYIIGGRKIGRLRECRAVLAEQYEGRCDRYHLSFHDVPSVGSTLGPELITVADSRKRDGRGCPTL